MERKTRCLIMVFTLAEPGKSGAGDGIRTRDIDLGKVALYQLSYSRPWENTIFTRNAGSVKRSRYYVENKVIKGLAEQQFPCARLHTV